MKETVMGNNSEKLNSKQTKALKNQKKVMVNEAPISDVSNKPSPAKNAKSKKQTKNSAPVKLEPIQTKEEPILENVKANISDLPNESEEPKIDRAVPVENDAEVKENSPDQANEGLEKPTDQEDDSQLEEMVKKLEALTPQERQKAFEEMDPKERKKLVRCLKKEKRQTKIPKHVKKRKEKISSQNSKRK